MSTQCDVSVVSAVVAVVVGWLAGVLSGSSRSSTGAKWRLSNHASHCDFFAADLPVCVCVRHKDEVVLLLLLLLMLLLWLKLLVVVVVVVVVVFAGGGGSVVGCDTATTTTAAALDEPSEQASKPLQTERKRDKTHALCATVLIAAAVADGAGQSRRVPVDDDGDCRLADRCQAQRARLVEQESERTFSESANWR